MMRKGPFVGYFRHGNQANCCGRSPASTHRKMFMVNGDLKRRLNHSTFNHSSFNISVHVMCCVLRLYTAQHVNDISGHRLNKDRVHDASRFDGCV